MTDFDTGLALLRQLGGTDDPAVLALFESVGAADFGAQAVAFVYGGVYQRPGLTLRQRQLITLSALATLGFAPAQLDFHRAAAENVGCTPAQIAAVIEPTESTSDTAELTETDWHLVLVAAHTAAGGLAPQLRQHLGKLDRQQAVEAVLHVAVYAGFPAALNALAVAREVFSADRG